MEQREWLNEYMSLKQVNPANPFTVPAGYFDELEQRVLLLKKLEELKGEGFTVPENYFDELSSNLKSRIAIEASAKSDEMGFAVPEKYFGELSSNIQSRIFIEAASCDELGFSVPEGYFNHLEQQIQSRITIEGATDRSEEQFPVPEGYFDNLEQQIQSRIFIEEALNHSDEQFVVPAGYFDKLTNTILDKTVNEQGDEARVVPMKQPLAVANKEIRRSVIRKMFASTAFKYASAACFALVIGAGFLLNSLSGSVDAHDKTALHKELSAISVDDIRGYLQLNEDAGDTQQAVISEGTPVDDNQLKNDLKNLLDSIQ